MLVDLPGRGHPDLAVVSCGSDMLQGTSQMTQSVGLANDVGVQGDARDHRR